MKISNLAYRRKNDIDRIKELSIKAKEIASQIANESKELFEKDEIVGEDFHKMLLAIQNLVEYLNRNYFNDEKIEEEVSTMTKTLYDPEVERKGIEKGIEKEKEKSRLKDVDRVLKLLTKKFGTLSDAFKEKIKNMDSDNLNLIIENILDIENLEEIEKYLN